MLMGIPLKLNWEKKPLEMNKSQLIYKIQDIIKMCERVN